MGVNAKSLIVDYLGCQWAMCPHCDYLQICPLHNEIDALRAEVELLRRVVEAAREVRESCSAIGPNFDCSMCDYEGPCATLRDLNAVTPKEPPCKP